MFRSKNQTKSKQKKKRKQENGKAPDPKFHFEATKKNFVYKMEKD